MRKFCGTLLIFFAVFRANAQDAPLPNDFRQQNLTEYNSNLLNPAYALDRNNPSSIAFWSRWQWQVYDADPTSLFLNYTLRLNESSAAGVGFFQHNTGIFLNTGGALNYAYDIKFNDKTSLGIGLNLFGYQQKLADDRFFIPNPIQTSITNDFIVQLAPGINFRVDKFSLGITSENLFDYNFSTSQRNTDPGDIIVFGLASYDIPLQVGSDGNSMIRPALYIKSIPGFDTQFGFTGLFSTSKFWVQGGYNSFYGVSGGVGGRFFKRFSIGALVELGIDSQLEGKDPSFELVTSYKLGNLEKPSDTIEEQLIAEETEKEEKLKAALEKEERLALKEESKEQEKLAKENAKRVKDSIQESNKGKVLAQKESRRDLKRRTDSINKAKAEAALAEARSMARKRRTDSINAVQNAKEEALALAIQRKKDSVAAATLAAAEAAEKKAELERLARQKEVVTVQKGEKYEEVTKEGKLRPGYYLIANVFGTKRYFEAFLADLKKKGLNPGSFYRDLNKYNYVYLARYDSIDEARKARDSKFGGKYPDKTWIFRVVGE
ncbi:PorP/SprF family type IX secretion system membrane protein [Maribacter sp. 2210JD10-5]|uniref:PorP/SprF family type IX secretion system membrane protein n=1 Tax=Maribacter sp. 2210JD10-5 TaxID=3386272 RepID=UPI0039BCCDA9